MKKLLIALTFTLFAGSAFAQTSGPIGDAMSPTGYLNFLYSGSFQLFYNGTNYQRWTGETWDSSMTLAPVSPNVNAFGVWYDGNSNVGRYWAGNLSADGVANTTLPYTESFLMGFNGTTWDRLRTITTQADAQAAATRGLVTSSFLYGYNGTTFDLLRVGASNELQVTDVATRPGEDAANDYRKIKIDALATDATAATTGVAITGGAGLTVVLAGYEVLGWSNVCAYLKNTDGGAAAFNDVEIYASPNNSDWAALGWTACDSLADGSTCVYCVSGNAYRYLQVKASSASDVTASGWWTMNKQ